MKITYDAATDSLYIALVDNVADGAARDTREVVPGLLIDLDGDGRVLGLELLRARANGVDPTRVLIDEAEPVAAARRLASLAAHRPEAGITQATLGDR